MKLKETPDLVAFPRTHFVFSEQRGSFAQGAPAAWKIIQQNYEKLASAQQILGTLSLYKVEPELIYRAGVVLAAKPTDLPTDLEYEEFAGGDYLRFLLTGPYSDLPKACARVFAIVAERGIKARTGAFYGERYLKDIRTTPEAELETEILVPVTAIQKTNS